MDYSRFRFHNSSPASGDLAAALTLAHGIELPPSMRAILTSAAAWQAGIREHLETCYQLS